jgi:hypothetical protein
MAHNIIRLRNFQKFCPRPLASAIAAWRGPLSPGGLLGVRFRQPDRLENSTDRQGEPPGVGLLGGDRVRAAAGLDLVDNARSLIIGSN